MKKFICFICACFFMTIPLFAQIPEPLQKKITGKKKLADIMQEVDKYYAALKLSEPVKKVTDKDCPACKENDEAYLHWKRWEYYNRGRLNDAGEIVNVAVENFEKTNSYKNQQRNIANATQAAVFNSAWSFIGPNNITDINNNTIFTGVARANAITFHPTNANIMWASTSSGGLFETANGGISWYCISNAISSLGIADMVVDYNNTSIMYVLTGDGESNNGSNWFVEAYGYLRFSTGVLKSYDGGISWQQTGLTFPSTDFRVGLKLAMHPTNPNILIAATNVGLYRTINGGNTWTLVQASIAGASNGFYDVTFKPNNPNIVYATGRENICAFFCSSDAGVTWSSTAASGLPSPGKRFTMEIPPAAPDSVYVLTGSSTSSSQYTGLYRGKYNSVNNTISFSLVNNSPNIISIDIGGVDSRNSTEYNLTMAINNNHVVTGATFCWHSVNYGGAFVGAGTNLHADIHELDYNPLNGNLYAASDGGIYKSTDNGVTFSCISDGLGATQIYHIADFEPDIAKLLIGTQDNGTNYKNSLSSNFRNIGGCDGFDVAFHPTNFDSCMFVCNTTIYASDNGGATNYVLNPPGHADWYSTVGFNPISTKIRYVGSENKFYRTANKGLTWTSLAGVRGNTALEICPNSNRIYTAGAAVVGAGVNGTATLYRIDNDFGSFTNLTTRPGMPDFTGNRRYVTSIASNPANNNDVWITISGYANGVKVFHSTDAGLNWQNESGNLPNVPVNAIAVDVNSNIYVGNDFGVFARRATDNDWFPFYNNLPNVPVTDIAINDLQSKITISTFGRGVWRSDALSTSCLPTLILTGNYNGQYSYQASNYINTTANVVNSSGSKLNINAGNYINLNIGFTANAGSTFKAQIAPCGPVILAKNDESIDKASGTQKVKEVNKKSGKSKKGIKSRD